MKTNWQFSPPVYAIEGEIVALETLLIAREQRFMQQQQLLAQYQQPVLSVTLLAAGAVKRNELLDKIFAICLKYLNACFVQQGWHICEQIIQSLPTGHQALFVLPVEALTLKRVMIEIEQSLPLARLWDLDVIDLNGQPISRQTLGFPVRTCLICNEEAKVCTRHRTHSITEIYAEMQDLLNQFELTQLLANQADDALRREIALTPKPGLVDRANNGSHHDMDFTTFEKSCSALLPFWQYFVQTGINGKQEDFAGLFRQLRSVGVQAEKAMFSATNGINTHKGAIFAFGLVLGAFGWLWGKHQVISVESLCDTVAHLTQGISRELQATALAHPRTAGEQLFAQYGLTGARGEAESGFALVRHYALAIFKQYANCDQEHQHYLILLNLMAHNNDTNVVHRGGLAGLQFVQQQAKQLLSNPCHRDKQWLKIQLDRFDQDCIKRHLSCGGSADLLALTIFFSFLLRG